jgi:C4-dicarboxylate transporter DctM subunit
VAAGGLLAAVGGSPAASAEAASDVARTAVERERAAGLAAGVAAMATIVPPSPALIVLAVTGGLSITTLFMAAIVPSVVLGVLLLLCVTSIAPLWRDLEAEQAGAPSDIASAVPILGMPAAGLGLMGFGIATPMEAAAITVLYALVAPGRRLAWDDLVWAVRGAVVTGGALMLLVTAVALASRLAARAGVLTPRDWVGAEWSLLGQLVVAGVVALVLGMLFDVAPAVVIAVPLLFPYAQRLGLDPVYFAMLTSVAAALGSTMHGGTPAVTAAAEIWDVERHRVVLWPVRVAFLAAWLAIALLPALALWLPRFWLG